MKLRRIYIFVFVPTSVDTGAHASSVREKASCFVYPDRDEALCERDIREDIEQGTRQTRAPQNPPFWTLFIYNPRPRRSRRD